ncbi:ABC transporter ATP-binding protein [Prosthecomicrobium pneumaticum]|uniref:Iron(III) transport system ATP-binding protein n=1 Tax=Prosthecomicrobium pneumaticum TaxID=81895 RepID=A0A7W9L1W9_9HYPH|nr:ABC transporter ATP-binding protein [Prosthecomicrobium pneumaticum]MBB5753008.1 iron(III) transport system ATP-binding protein [Prosthecomicrobium pneumaticum]
MIEISTERLSKTFAATRALDAVSLTLPAGSFTALLGPSGCGKTTLLRLIAGFEAPDEGVIRFDGRVIADPRRQIGPEDRGIGVVFQSYALWPHMDVAGNVGYPLATRGVGRAERAARIAEVLGIVGLSGAEGRRIDELSGGQRQRVALARCLVAEAGVILFDEPLANLDVHLRAAMVEAFREVHRRSGATILYVTHDQSEALALADRVAVMQGGRIAQLAAPEQIYRAPADAMVAGFVGRGALVSGEVRGAAERQATVEVAGVAIPARAARPMSGSVRLLLRPEGLRIAADAQAPALAATVASATYRGAFYEVVAAIANGERLLVDCVEAPAVGAPIRIAVSDAWVVPG